MKKLFGIVAMVALSAGAAEYYVGSAAGDDAAAGTSPQAAWRSLEKVNAAELRPGDVVRFKRGGLWRGSLVPCSGEPGRPVTYTSYGTGAKPILQQSVDRSRPEDWTGFGRKSVWYNSRFYRANLVMDGTRLVFRDIHKMSDDFEEPFLDKVCTGWQALYFTPPVIDQWMFRGKDASGVMAFGGELVSIETAADGDVLVVTAKRADGTAATVRFEEGRIVVSGAGSLDAEYADGEFRKTISVADGGVNFVFQGFCYRVPVRGEVKSTAKGFSISGDRIALDLSTADR